MSKLIKPLLLFTGIFILCAISSANPTVKKLISKRWKMIKVYKSGKEISPEHEQLVIHFKKNGSFIFTAKFEETHQGTWVLSDDEKTITLDDNTNHKKFNLEVQKLDKGHLSLANFDGEKDKVVYMIPLSNKKAMVLNHREFLLAKEWTVSTSDKKETEGMRFVFNVNKTFTIFKKESTIPVSSGKWKLSENKKKVLMDTREEHKHLELNIVEIHRHKLILKNEENGLTKTLIDHRLEESKVSK